MQTDFSQILSEFSPTSLKAMDNVKLMNRTDTKFVFSIDKLANILGKATELYDVLEIDNHRLLDYRTLYFDTENLDFYNAHQNGKLNRYKVRHREYLISNISFLEIKFKSNKERTIKKRIQRKRIEENFAKKSTAFLENKIPYSSKDLKPKLYNKFSRITLVHKHNKERVTIDVKLGFKSTYAERELPFLVIAEVKQEGFSNLSDFIRLLKSEHIRPTGMSKYCIGTILTNNNIKYNRFKEKLIKLKKISYECNYNFDVKYD